MVNVPAVTYLRFFCGTHFVNKPVKQGVLRMVLLCLIAEGCNILYVGRVGSERMLCIGFNRSQMFCKDLVISAVSIVTTNPGNAKSFESLPV